MRNHCTRHRILSLTLLGVAAFAPPVLAQRRGGGGFGAQSEDLNFRFMGPAVGNRISAAAGIAGDPTTYYVGRGVGRCLEEHRWRAELGADLR